MPLSKLTRVRNDGFSNTKPTTRPGEWEVGMRRACVLHARGFRQQAAKLFARQVYEVQEVFHFGES